MIEDFGSLNGEKYSLYTIENNFLKISVTDYGARLVNFICKKNNTNIIKGFDNVVEYYNDDNYVGASVGRVCNRIKNAQFKLNKQVYQLDNNDNGNCLHGGFKGFAFQKWQVEIADNLIICKYLSPDLEGGFPGAMQVEVIYSIDGNALNYKYKIISDQDSIASITNHAYFNLNGRTSDSIANHLLYVNANDVALLDNTNVASEVTMPVIGSIFDFNKYCELKKVLQSKDLQLQLAHGLDHHFIRKNDDVFISCIGSKCKLQIYTDLPGGQIYTANFFTPVHSAICFETQYYPNAINYQRFKKPLILKNKAVVHETKYLVSEVK